MRKSIITATMVGLFALPAVSMAGAIQNPSFEERFTGWTPSSTAKVSMVGQHTSTVNVWGIERNEVWKPTDGKLFALLRSGEPTSLTSNLFFVEKGQELSFDYFFSAHDENSGGKNDYAGFSVELGGDFSDAVTLASVEDVGDYWSTGPGWLTASYIFPESGEVSLGFFSNNIFPDNWVSLLGVDNISISSVAKVSEPATLSLMALGILAIFGFTAKRREKSGVNILAV